MCVSEAFLEKARNNFSFILSNSESEHEFAEALKVLPTHARDEHEWDGGKSMFHALKVCSCGVEMMHVHVCQISRFSTHKES